MKFWETVIRIGIANLIKEGRLSNAPGGLKFLKMSGYSDNDKLVVRAAADKTYGWNDSIPLDGHTLYFKREGDRIICGVYDARNSKCLNRRLAVSLNPADRPSIGYAYDLPAISDIFAAF